MNRRGLFKLLGGAAIAAAVPKLWVPKQTIFLPPAGGWVSGQCLITLRWIQEEALRVLHEEMHFTNLAKREYDKAFWSGDQWAPEQIAVRKLSLPYQYNRVRA